MQKISVQYESIWLTVTWLKFTRCKDETSLCDVSLAKKKMKVELCVVSWVVSCRDQ